MTRPTLRLARTLVGVGCVVACRTSTPSLDSPSLASPSLASSESPTWRFCSIAGAVRLVQHGRASYALSRAELVRIIEAVRSHVRRGTKRGEVVPRRLADGRVGLRIHGVWPGARCGVEQGDTLLSLDGIDVDDVAAIERHVATLPAAPGFTLRVERNAKTLELQYALHD